MNPGFFLLLALATAQDSTQSATLAIARVNVVDVAGGELLPDRTVLIRGDRIDWVGPASEARVPDGAQTVDGAGKFLIPGLWDMHVHVPRNWDAGVSLPLFVAHGVTGVRDMGSDCEEPDDDLACLPGMLAWREAIAKGELVGPRLLALSSWIVSSDGDVGGDAAALVESFAERGADFVKILQGLSPEVFFDLVAAAEERGLPVAGHVPLAVGVLEAAVAGQASVEHARDFLFDGFPGSEEWRATTDTQNPPTAVLRRMVDEHDPARVLRVAEAMVRSGTRYVPTHVTRRFDAFADDEAYLDDPRRIYIPAIRWDSWTNDADSVLLRDPSPDGRTVFMDFYTRGLEATGTALAAGVEILAGTDANDSYVFPGSSLHDELEELVKAGLSPAEALRSATLAGARFLGRTADHGTVEVGRRADLVLLKRDPLADIANTRSIDAVVFDGRLHTRRQLDELLERVAARVAEMDPDVGVPTEQLDRYVGAYDSPMGRIEVSRMKDALFLRFPGRALMRLRALSETDFVILPQDASFSFDVDGDGKVAGLHFARGERSGTARKIE